VEVVKIDAANSTVTISRPDDDSLEEKEFSFDSVFGPETSQESIYQITASDIVESVIKGFNGTIFAYGQTGAGKTYTMTGGSGAKAGIIPRVFTHLFEAIETNSKDNLKFLIQISFMEIYNEEIRDLLGASKNVQLQERPGGSVVVKGVSTIAVKSPSDMISYLASGLKNRATGSTLMNSESSRSHSIFVIVVESSDPQGRVKMGKLNLVDLAGSERQSKTGAVGDTLKEAAKINLSLSALGNVISALVEGSKSGFVPYRDSKLTRLLQDSLGGNTKTVLISNIGPAGSNYEESLSTLRFSARAKKIKNKPRINEDPKDAQIRGFQEEIERLRYELQGRVVETGSESELRKQLLEMETKLLHGHQAVESELAAARAELERKAGEEEQVRKCLIEQSQERKQLEDRFVSQIDQVGELKKKLEKVAQKYKRAKEDMRDVQIEFQEERESLLATIRELQKMVKLNELVIETLVPDEEVKKLEQKCWFDDELNEWVVEKSVEDDTVLIPDEIIKFDLTSAKPSWDTITEIFNELQQSVYFRYNESGSLVRDFDPQRIPLAETPVLQKTYVRPQTAIPRPATADRRGHRPLVMDETIPKARGLVKPNIN
jgi:kinesin family protein 3/17